jgi:hypothetical protein
LGKPNTKWIIENNPTHHTFGMGRDLGKPIPSHAHICWYISTLIAITYICGGIFKQYNLIKLLE